MANKLDGQRKSRHFAHKTTLDHSKPDYSDPHCINKTVLKVQNLTPFIVQYHDLRFGTNTRPFINDVTNYMPKNYNGMGVMD